jgi:hypothetical protein
MVTFCKASEHSLTKIQLCAVGMNLYSQSKRMRSTTSVVPCMTSSSDIANVLLTVDGCTAWRMTQVTFGRWSSFQADTSDETSTAAQEVLLLQIHLIWGSQMF